MKTIAKASIKDTTPNRQFLVHCLRAYLAAGTPSGMPLAEPVDWDSLVPLAAFHRVAPLLHRALRAGCSPAAPASVRADLAAYVRSVSTRSLLLTGELVRLLRRLDAEGIQAIPFKGPALAIALYGDPALRHFDDLDILVRQHDFAAGKSVVLSVGYQPRERHSHHKSFTLARENVEIVLELHRHIVISPEVFPFTPNLKEIWDRCESLSFAGTKVTTLSPEDLLLFLCAHGSRHLWFCLQWVCDVAQLIRRYPALDWGSVMEQARVVGGRRALFLGVALASDVLGAPLPPEIEQAVRRDGRAAKLARQVKRQLFEGPLVVVKPWKEALFPLQLIDRLPDRIGYLPRYWFRKLTTGNHPHKGA